MGCKGSKTPLLQASVAAADSEISVVAKQHGDVADAQANTLLTNSSGTSAAKAQARKDASGAKGSPGAVSWDPACESEPPQQRESEERFWSSMDALKASLSKGKSLEAKETVDIAARSANLEMVTGLRNRQIITKTAVHQAMLSVNRGNYTPQNSGKRSYEDTPLSIGYAVTISAPHMHAHSLELLAGHLIPGSRALDVGSGSGYITACMARMVGPKGFVVGVECLLPLVDLAIGNIQKADSDLFNDGQLVLMHGDGWAGCSEHAPFDCIHVGAAAHSVPTALLKQLKPGGRMVIPIGMPSQSQYLYQIDRRADGKFPGSPGEYIETKLMPVRYVPLVKAGTGVATPPDTVELQRLLMQAEKSAPEPVKDAPPEGEELAPEPVEKDTSFVALPADACTTQPVALPVVTVTGASFTPSMAKCRWCKDVCC